MIVGLVIAAPGWQPGLLVLFPGVLWFTFEVGRAIGDGGVRPVDAKRSERVGEAPDLLHRAERATHRRSGVPGAALGEAFRWRDQLPRRSM